MKCLEPTDKKTFGLDVYKKLNDDYGQKRHYEVAEIEDSVIALGYLGAYTCWALVAFMLPANVGEYFRAKGTPMDVLMMKREFILAMTNGERNSLNLPKGVKSMYDIEVEELTQMNLVNMTAMYIGLNLGNSLIDGMLGK